MSLTDNKPKHIRRRFKKADVLILFLVDAASFFLALWLFVRWYLGRPFLGFVNEHPDRFLINLVIFIAALYFFDLYYVIKDFRRYRQIVNLMLATMAGMAVSSLASFWYPHLQFPGKRFLLCLYAMLFVFAGISRGVFSVLRVRVFPKRALIVGCSEIGRVLLGEMREKKKDGCDLGIDIIGYISRDEGDCDGAYPGIPRAGSFSNVQFVSMARDVDLLIYAIDEEVDSKVDEVIIREKLRGSDLISANALLMAITGKIFYEHVNSSWLIEECLRGNKFAEARIKRIIDLLIAPFLLLISIPIIAASALLIQFESPGPPIFVQVRIGRFGRPFKVYKLRTMRVIDDNSPEIAEGWHHRNVERITPLGSFLRKSHMDEMPQFWNVIKGDMSIVGPRPEMEVFIRQCENAIPFYRLRLAVRPGVTGWAQVWFAHTSTMEGYKDKFKYDLYYLVNLSIKLDLEIVIRTVFRIFGYPKIGKRPGENKFSEEDV